MTKSRITRRLSFAATATGVVACLALMCPQTARALTGPVVVGNKPVAVGIDSVNHRVLVTNSTNSVSFLDGNSATPTAVNVMVGAPQSGIAVDSAAHLAFVTLPNQNKVAVIDTSAAIPALIRDLAVGSFPTGIAIDPSTHIVFVANSASANVSRFDGTKTTPTVSTIGVGAVPLGIGVDTVSHTVFVSNTNDDSVTTFSSLDGLVTRSTIPIGPGVGAVAVDSASHSVFVSNTGGSSVYRFDGSSATPTPTNVAVGLHPQGISVDEASGTVYVSNFDEDSISHFDAGAIGTPKVTTETVGGSGPLGLAVDSSTSTVYAALSKGTSVARLGAVTPEAPSLTSSNPPAAVVGTPYSFTFTATGRPIPTIALIGTLPPGLAFDSARGVLSGTPTTAGSYPIVVAANSAAGRTVGIQYILTVNVPSPTSTPTPSTPPTSTSTAAAAPSTATAGGSQPGGKAQLAHTGADEPLRGALAASALGLLAAGAASGLLVTRRRRITGTPSARR